MINCLHANKHQHSWKWLELDLPLCWILPFSPFYAGVDGIELSFNSRQQAPPHLALYSSRVKVKRSHKKISLKVWNKYMKYSRPYLLPVNFEVSTLPSWIIGKWNGSDSSPSSLSTRQMGFLLNFLKLMLYSSSDFLSGHSFSCKWFLTMAKCLPNFHPTSNDGWYVELGR